MAEPVVVAQAPAAVPPAVPAQAAPAQAPVSAKPSAPTTPPAKAGTPAPEQPARTVDLQPWNPSPAPRLELDNLDGTPFDPAVLRGKRVLLNFWAVWCLPCREEIPALQRLADLLKGQNVEVVLVNVGDSRAANDRFLEKLPTNLRILRTRGSSPRFGDWNIVALPATALLDGSGVPRWRAIGRVDGKASEALVAKRLVEMARPK